MGRYASNSGGGDFKQAPAGTHIARCFRMVDLGTQHSEYLGEPIVRNQFIVMFELPLETIEIDGVEKPLIVSKFYTNSMNEKATWRKDLESWRSKPFTDEEVQKFDNEAVLGKPLMVSVVLNDKGKARVVGVSAVPKGMTCPPQVNPSQKFWIDEWDDNKFAALPQGLKDIIVKSDEYKAAFTPPVNEDADDPNEKFDSAKHVDKMDDDIPF